MTEIFRKDHYFREDFPFAIRHTLNDGESFNLRHRFKREFWKITYIVEGSASLVIGEESCPVGPGTIYLVHPEDETTYDLAADKKLELYNILFDVDFIASFPEGLKDDFHFFSIFSREYQREKGPYCYIFTAPEGVREKILALEEEYENQFPNRNLMIQLLLQELLLLLLRSSRERFHHHPQAIISYVRCRVMEDFRKPLTLGSLAASVGVTSNYLCRLYRKYFASNLNKDLLLLRLAFAAKLLRETQKDITLICGESGFRDISYFYRTFKKHFGASPAIYRQKMIGKN